MERYVIDTYAWIEYIRGTPEGLKAKEYIENKENITPTIVVLEYEKYLLKRLKEKTDTLKNYEAKREYVRSISTIVNLDYALSISAAKLDLEMKEKIKNWGMADSIVLATARSLNAKVVTGDEHFRGLKDAVLIK
ncbi:MAG: type II toxin-antitoxin system VapC family toxin [Candidatus Altiarchaeia archaeon]